MSKESLLVEKECPKCKADFLLRYKAGRGYLYCPECATLFSERPKGELIALVPTTEPYADWSSMYKGWRE